MSTIVMSNTDPGEGSPLQSDNFLAIYGGKSILDVFYPVGSFYKTADITFDPNVSWGGVWVEDTDYVLIAYLFTKGGSGTTIQEQKNVSSFVRNSTGNYDLTFTKAAADADYIVTVSGEASGLASECFGVYQRSTTKFRVDFGNYDGTAIDMSEISISVWGRLANPDYRIWKRTA